MATSTEDRVRSLTDQVRHLQAQQRLTQLALFLCLALGTLLLPAARLDEDNQDADSASALSLFRLCGLLLRTSTERFGDVGEYPFRLPVGLLLAQVGTTLAFVAVLVTLILAITIPGRPTSRRTSTIVLVVAGLLVLGCVLGALGVWLLPDSSDDLDPAAALLTGIGAGVWLAVDARE